MTTLQERVLRILENETNGLTLAEITERRARLLERDGATIPERHLAPTRALEQLFHSSLVKIIYPGDGAERFIITTKGRNELCRVSPPARS